MRQRSLAARYEKARRGELVVASHVGFINAGDRIEKDPDRRIQEAIALVFDKVTKLAFFRPRRLAIFMAHVFKAKVSGLRVRIELAAS
jgi:hypothetical protein